MYEDRRHVSCATACPINLMQFVKLTNTCTDCMFSPGCAHQHLILLHVCIYPSIHAVLTFMPKLLNVSLIDSRLGLHVNLGPFSPRHSALVLRVPLAMACS